MMMHGHEGPPHGRWWPSRYHHRDRDDPPPPKPNGSRTLSYILRLLCLLLALSSAVLLATSADCTPTSGSGTGTNFTYTRFSAFVLLVGANITATVLGALAMYLQIILDLAAAAAPDDADKTLEEIEEEAEASMPAAGIALVVLDLIVLGLLFASMGAAYDAAALAGDQIGACPKLARQVEQAKILSLSACFAVMLAAAAKQVPLPFNVPPVLG